MPDPRTIQRAKADKRAGKSPGTQAGEFVREEIEHVREGKHGVRSTKQAIAIGLSKARRAGVDLPPRPGKTKSEEPHPTGSPPNPRRSRATSRALEREGHSAASPGALARQAKGAARKHSAGERSASARKAARTRARERS